MTRTQLILLAAGGSLAVLLGAFGFQYLGGLAPCPICIWQRWPHGLAGLTGLLALAVPGPWFPRLGSLIAVTGAGIALYHSGIERKWWAGPSTCTGDGLSGMSGSDLLSITDAPTVVMCDQIPWQMFGLSMANYNVLISLTLAILWWAASMRRA